MLLESRSRSPTAAGPLDGTWKSHWCCREQSVGFTQSKSDQACKRTKSDVITSRAGKARDVNETWCRGPRLEKNTWITTKTTRSDWTAAAHDEDVKTDSTERTSAMTSHRTATSTAGHRTTTETATTTATHHQSRCRQNNHNPHHSRIVAALGLKLKESAKQREQEARCSSKAWCLSQVLRQGQKIYRFQSPMTWSSKFSPIR